MDKTNERSINNMWTIIRNYYLFLFILFFVLFSISAFTTDSPNSVIVILLIAFAGALVISLSCGTLYYFRDTKWGPKRREKMMIRAPFHKLLQHGFIRKDNLFYGKINGYTTVVRYTRADDKKIIKVKVLFDPRIAGQWLSREMLNDLSNRNKPANTFTGLSYVWTKNSIEQTFEYILEPPTYDMITKQAEVFTQILTLERLKPINFEEAERLSNSIL